MLYIQGKKCKLGLLWSLKRHSTFFTSGNPHGHPTPQARRVISDFYRLKPDIVPPRRFPVRECNCTLPRTHWRLRLLAPPRETTWKVFQYAWQRRADTQYTSYNLEDLCPSEHRIWGYSVPGGPHYGGMRRTRACCLHSGFARGMATSQICDIAPQN